MNCNIDPSDDLQQALSEAERDCAFCRRSLQVVSVICAAMVLAVGALGIWTFSVSSDFLHGLYVNRGISEGNAQRIEQVRDIVTECRRMTAQTLDLVGENHEALRLLSECESRESGSNRSRALGR